MSAFPWPNPYQEPLQPRHRGTLLGPLEMVTPATTTVLTTAELKAHCRVDIDDDNTYLDALGGAATEYVEKELPGNRQLLTTTFDVPAETWWSGPLRLPRPPLISVTSVKYYDTVGTLTTLAATEYLVRTPWRQPGTIERAPWHLWPAYQSDRQYPIQIRFVAGYGVGTAVPKTLRQAILLLVGHWYVIREPVVMGMSPSSEIEMTVHALLNVDGWGSYA